MSINITPDMVRMAVDHTHLRLARGVGFYTQPNHACPLGVLYCDELLSAGRLIPDDGSVGIGASRWGDEHFGAKYCHGFVNGFDGDAPAESESDDVNGWSDGRRIYEELIEKKAQGD
jgi:hypothetical protein